MTTDTERTPTADDVVEHSTEAFASIDPALPLSQATLLPLHLSATKLPAVAPVSITTQSGLRLHALQTGWGAIKSAHHSLRGPAPLRVLRIMHDQQWTSWLPLLTWVIEHPEGTILIDTAVRAQATDPEHLAADPASRWFFAHNLRLVVRPEEEVAKQLHRLGIAPSHVRWLVMTHLHFDHADAMNAFPEAEVVVARQEYEGHRRLRAGAVPRLWPTLFHPHLITYTGPALGDFAATHHLTRDGSVVLLPTPGHSYGHQSVLVRDTSCDYLFAGDVAFTEQQLLHDELGGITWNLRQARASLARVRSLARSRPLVFLPTHDLGSRDRFVHRRTLSARALEGASR